MKGINNPEISHILNQSEAVIDLVGDLLLGELSAAAVVAHGLPRPRRLLPQQVQSPLRAEAPEGGKRCSMLINQNVSY